jgi:hypothetical protein
MTFNYNIKLIFKKNQKINKLINILEMKDNLIIKIIYKIIRIITTKAII